MRQKRHHKMWKARAALYLEQDEKRGKDAAVAQVEAPAEAKAQDGESCTSEARAGEQIAGEEKEKGGEADAAGLQNLAAFYHVQGYYQEAEKLYRQALDMFERDEEKGVAPTAIATTLRNLALLYENQSRYQEAEEFYRRAQSVMEQASEDVYSTAVSIMRDYADLLHTLGRDQEAQDLEARISKV